MSDATTKRDLSEAVNIPDHVPQDLIYAGGQQSDPEFAIDPYGVLKETRENAPPIYYSPNFDMQRPNSTGAWIITRAADAREALQQPDLFTTAINYGGGDGAAWPRRLIPLELDPPEHQKYRALLAPLFSPKSIDKMEADVLDICHDLMDRVMDKGECNFQEDFARPYPVTVFMKMMGLPMEEQDQFVRWEKMALNSTTREEAKEGGTAIAAYLMQLVQDRRKNPKDDLVSMLTQAKVDGKPIEDEYIHDMAFLLFLAGLDTVTAGHMHIFYYLAANPDRKQELIDDPELIPNAVEELLRYHSWIGSGRYVTRDVEFHGIQMKEGDHIRVSHALCGHDPAEFPNPETIDFHREPNPHFAFAAGVHRCAGSHLARRELRISVREWLLRAPDFHVKDNHKVTYMTQGMFHPEDLTLAWKVK